MKVYSYKLVRVVKDYYDQSLETRANILRTPSTFHLCKTIVMENKNFAKDDSSNDFDITNSRYYCIVIQYEHKLDAEKLRDFVLELKPKGQRLPRKRYHFHLGKVDFFFHLTI